MSPRLDHNCTGAECPACGVFPVGRVTFGKTLPSLHDLFTGRYTVTTQPTLPDARLDHFRDSLGQAPTSYPKELVPSITAIIRDPVYTGPGWRVLVHQRKDNQHWGFLGGGQHIGESILDTVHREVKEESGVEVTIDRLVCVDSDPTQWALCSYKDGVVHYCNMSFLCTYKSGILRMSEESLFLGWRALTNDLPEPFLERHRWRLQQAMSCTGEVVVR